MDTDDVCYSIDLTAAQRRATTRWMRSNVSDYIDECGEVETTRLAEDCANELELYGPGTTAILHDVFDVAAETADAWERNNTKPAAIAPVPTTAAGNVCRLCSEPADTIGGRCAGLCTECAFAAMGGE